MKRRPLALTATMLVLLAMLLPAGAQPVAAQSGPQPGATDPMGKPSRYTVLYDDDVFNPGAIASSGNNAQFLNAAYSTDANLNYDGEIFNGGGPGFDFIATQTPQWWSARGRVTTSNFDQVVSLWQLRPGQPLDVYISDQSLQGASVFSYAFSNMADRVYTSDLVDIEIGDVDRLTDSKGNYHDEVVVAYASGTFEGGYRVNLNVLNYTNGCQGPLSPIQPCTATTVQASHPIDPWNNDNNWVQGLQDNIIGVAVGDFDGDGVDEIAVAYLQNQTTLWVTTFRYTGDGKGGGTLAEVASYQNGVLPYDNPLNDIISGSVSLEAGDFDGSDDNTDELLLGQVQYENDGNTQPEGSFQGWATILTFDGNLVPQYANSLGVDIGIWAPELGQPVRMQLEPGLFQFDPGAGFDFDRRQFAMAYNVPILDQTLVINAYAVNADYTFTPLWESVPLSSSLPETGQRFSIAAGGYRGVGSTDPTWGLAFQGVSAISDANGYYEHVGMIDGSTGAVVQDNGVENHSYFENLRTPLVAYDYYGDSIYLGAPVHFTADNVIDTDFVLQEPPKHAYYDNDPRSQTYGQVVTVSRYDTFNLALQDSSNTSFSSTSTDTSSNNFGVAGEEDASATVSEGADIGIANVSASATIAYTGTQQYDYQENKKSYNSAYASRTVSFSGQTNRDDYLEGRAQTYDIWRYRVYGTTIPPSGGQQPNAFYNVVLPGPVEQFAGGGQSFDWYQPLHENGNILSYPGSLGIDNLPSDLGVYTDTTAATVKQPLVPASLQAFDGTSGSVALQYSSTSGAGFMTGYTSSLSFSNDIAGSYKATAEVLGEGGSVSVGMQVKFTNGSSNAGSVNSNQTTGKSTGITLSKPAGNGDQGYQFSPIFYITRDGTVKAAHSASVLGNPSGQAFWADLYGAKADPALSLPGRFDAVLDQNVLIGWRPDVGGPNDGNSGRKQLRGFALGKTELNPISGAYDPLAYAPAAGDKVRVATNVYNYSTAVAASNLLVQFQAIPYNADDDLETPYTTCPGKLQITDLGRCIIGQTTIPSISTAGSGNMQQAAVTWDTTGFGPTPSQPAGQYRIYAVLDPNNTIDEIYETEDPSRVYPWVDGNGNARVLPRGVDPGQNNEGYGVATVVAAGQTLVAVPADVSLNANSLAVLDAQSRRPNSDNARATINTTTRTRITLYSDRVQREFNEVQIYDGDPATGGVLLAQKRVFAGDPDGASVWFDWLPETPGQHTLYARVLNDHDDPRFDNGTDTLSVTVAAPSYRAFTPLMVNRARVNSAQ